MRLPLSTLSIVTGLALSAGLEAQPRIVYANNDAYTSNSVSGFSADANGVLTEISGSPFATGGGGTGGGGYSVNRIAVSGTFLFAADGGTHDVSAFSIDPNTGFLTPVPNSPFSAGSTAGWGDISLAASPDGTFLFAGMSSNLNVVTFKVGSDGSLAPAASTLLPAAPTGMKVSPDGKFLAVGLPGYNGLGAVAMFSIGTGGSLTMVNGTPFSDLGAGNLSGVDIDCAGRHLFGAEMTPGAPIIDVFSVGSAGALTPVQGSPFSPVNYAAVNSNIAVLSPNDQFLFVSNQGSNSLSAFNVDSTGALSLVAGSPFAAGNTIPAGMATDQGGTLLYIASSNTMTNLIYVFTIAADGSLTQAPNSPFSTNQTGGLLSLASFPAKTCSAGSGGGTPPAPPVISGMPAGSCTLWPPNGQFIQVATVTAMSSLSQIQSFTVTGVSSEPSDSNDPDVVITGDGVGPRTILLRAARLGNGTGRIYTLTATATDIAGNTTSSTEMCTVPHDQSR
jgi:6-phosphogluconolactonase (cycloisomerase 2 family)